MENGYKGTLSLPPSHLSVPVEHFTSAGIAAARHARGFTIVELMIVVLVAAVLAMIAIPSFDTVIKRNRIESIQSQFSAALAAARTTATSRNAVVVVCASDGGEFCREDVVGDWGDGWLVFIDSNTPLDNKRDADEQVLEVFRNNNDYNISAVAGPGQTPTNSIAYGYRGFLKSGVLPTLIKVCEPDNNASLARGLFVSTSGTVMKTRDGADDDNIHNSPLAAGNVNLACN